MLKANSMKKLYPYLFLLPFLSIYLLFSFFPVVFTLIISFVKWDGSGQMLFVGLNNYIRLLSDTVLHKSLYNTMLFMAIAIPMQIFTGLLLAVLIKDNFKRTRGLFQLMNFVPYLTTPVAIGLLFQILFDWQYGTVNQILVQLGLVTEPHYWLGMPISAQFVLILLVYWKYYGYMMIMFMAGLSTIPAELYEAADIDGAKNTDKFFKITLPLLKPIITFVVTMCIIGGFQLFDEPNMLFKTTIGGPEKAGLTVVMKFYDIAFQRFDLGYGASLAYGLFIIIFSFSFVTIRLMNRGSEK